MNFTPVSAFCVKNEGKASFLMVEEEVASTSGEEGRILVPKVKSAVFLSGPVDRKIEVFGTYGCVTESVKRSSFSVCKITCVGPNEVDNTLE